MKTVGSHSETEDVTELLNPEELSTHTHLLVGEELL